MYRPGTISSSPAPPATLQKIPKVSFIDIMGGGKYFFLLRDIIAFLNCNSWFQPNPYLLVPKVWPPSLIFSFIVGFIASSRDSTSTKVSSSSSLV